MYYVQTSFRTKEEADNFLEKMNKDKWDMFSYDEFHYRHVYKDIRIVVEDLLDLPSTEIEKIDMDWILDELLDYDSSSYYEYLVRLVTAQLQKRERQLEKELVE